MGEAARRVTTNIADPWQVFNAFQSIPTLLLHGEHSDILTDEIAAKMRKRKPDLKYVVVKNRGHVPLLDEPECLEAIDRFLGKLNE